MAEKSSDRSKVEEFNELIEGHRKILEAIGAS